MGKIFENHNLFHIKVRLLTPKGAERVWVILESEELEKVIEKCEDGKFKPKVDVKFKCHLDNTPFSWTAKHGDIITAKYEDENSYPIASLKDNPKYSYNEIWERRAMGCFSNAQE